MKLQFFTQIEVSNKIQFEPCVHLPFGDDLVCVTEGCIFGKLFH